MRLGMEQNILRIAWNHSSLIRDFWFELSHARKHSNDFTVFPNEFSLLKSWVRVEKTFLTLFDLFPSRIELGVCFVYVRAETARKAQNRKQVRQWCSDPFLCEFWVRASWLNLPITVKIEHAAECTTCSEREKFDEFCLLLTKFRRYSNTIKTWNNA